MNVLAVFAHPDDEVLGCGGTLAKHAEAGDKVVASMLAGRLYDEARRARRALGIARVHTWDFPDQAFDTIPFSEKLVDAVEYLDESYEPDVVYTHHPGDLNLDHALTARAVLTVFRPKPGEKPRTILACEVLSSTEWTFPQQFSPNWFEALDGSHLDKKVAAMECYPSELKVPRDEDGIHTLAAYRGNQCGVDFAEAFQLLRCGPC